MKFLVRHDFSKFRPTWGRDRIRQFGERNEGFTIEAENYAAALALLEAPRSAGGYNLNPFYLLISPESGAS